MEKIQLTICCGTYCHVMGGAELHQIDEIIPPELARYVEIRHSTCLGYCKEGNGNPPFVDINGKFMSESSLEKILMEIKSLIGGIQDDSK